MTAFSHSGPGSLCSGGLSRLLRTLTPCVGVLMLLACATASEPRDWKKWKAKRLESVAGTNGWTTLIAREWLPEGRSGLGSGPTNAIRVPAGRGAESMGVFTRLSRVVRFEAADGVQATVSGKPAQSIQMVSDTNAVPTKLLIGGLAIQLIERGEKFGIRIRDPQSAARRHFKGLQTFAYDPMWRIEGRFEAFPLLKTLEVSDVIGGTQRFPSPGALVFQAAGQACRLDVAVEPDEEDYFVMFKDRTAGDETYGAGRFLYVSKPGPDGRVVIDFNKAYTPPCGFTSFATCPLPPRQNVLTFPIRAGERRPMDHP